MATILTKKSDTAASVPLVADLTNAAGGAELAVNTADKRLFTKTSGGTVVELGTNPSALTLPNGTANGIPYLNGSKVLTSGSALTFDGTTFKNAGTANNEFAIDTSGTPILSMVGGASTIPLIGYKGSGLRFGSVTGAGAAGFSEQMQLTSSGNLGLGVTPSAWNAYKAFQFGRQGVIFGDAGGGTASFGSNLYWNSGWKYIFTEQASFYSQASGSHQWFTAPSGTAGNAITFTQAMTLDASGNLLVGTTSASSLSGNCFNYNPTTSNSAYGHASGISSGTNYIGFLYAGGTIGSITQNGTTAVAYNTTSDHRLKNNVRTADALRFKDIRFVDFEWVDGRHDCGVIAHELQAIYPDLVVGTKDETEVRTVELTPAVPAVLDEEGNVITPEVPAVTEEQTFDKHQQVNYIGLIPRMGTIVQQLMAKVEAMEAEIAALKAAP